MNNSSMINHESLLLYPLIRRENPIIECASTCINGAADKISEPTCHVTLFKARGTSPCC
jgi:hypothetical protein